MGLLAPWFLLGGASLAIPLLLHLVRRPEPSGRPFPSLMFLRRIPFRTRNRKTLRDPLLLALRCLALALLALAFAGPYLPRDRAAVEPQAGNTDRVLLLDRSYSMGYPGRWAAALEAVSKHIDQLASGERAALVAFDGEFYMAQALTDDRDLLERSLGRLSPGPGRTDYAAALAGAAMALRDSTAARREVVLVSDLQRAGLDGIRTPRLAENIALELVPVGPPAASNAAVMEVELLPRGATDNARRTLAVRVRNTGQETASAVRVTTSVDHQATDSAVLDISPGSEQNLQLPLVLARDRATRIEVRLSADGVPADDEFFLVAAEERPVNVLLVAQGGGRAHDGLFLQQALAIARSPAFAVSSAPLDDLNPALLSRNNVLILDDVPLADPVLGRWLTEFLARGGGLLVVAATGPRGAWPGGRGGFLPGRLGPVVERSDTGRIGVWDGFHPLLEILRSASARGFAQAGVDRYRQLTPSSEDRVLLRFDDGAPALVERLLPPGRVLVMTTTLDPRWSSLAAAPGFAPFVIETVRFLADRPRLAAYLRIGVPFDLVGQAATLPAAAGQLEMANPQHDIVVEDPKGHTVRLSPKAAWYAPTLTGHHEVHGLGGRGTTIPVAVNADRNESNLAALSTEELMQAIERPRAVADAAAPTPANAAGGARFWWWLLAAAGALLCIEALLANRLARNTADSGPAAA